MFRVCTPMTTVAESIEESKRRVRLRWIIIIGSWAAYFVLMTAQTYFAYAREGKPIPLLNILLPAGMYCLSWLLLTPLVLLLSEHFPLDRTRWRSSLTIHLIASLVIAIFHRLFTDVMVVWIRMGAEWAFAFNKILASLIGYFDYGVLVYWIIVLLDQGVKYYRTIQEEKLRTSQLETRLAEARLEALRNQLHPHFLFNTLNSISALIHISPRAADTMIARLGDFLRITLDNSGERFAPLVTELQALHSYFDIERVRFADKVTLETEIEPAALGAQVPCFVWQPLLENAIKHGIETSGGSGRITVRAQSRNGSLLFQIQDTGPGLSDNGSGTYPVHEGIGLSRTRAILEHLYGSDQQLEIRSVPGGGVLASLTIPFRTAGSTPEDVDETGIERRGSASGHDHRRRAARPPKDSTPAQG
jgi:two-component system, LytTR family, sensor kinase